MGVIVQLLADNRDSGRLIDQNYWHHAVLPAMYLMKGPQKKGVISFSSRQGTS